MEDHPAEQLDVEVAHVQRPAARLAHDAERLRQQIVERLATLEALPELSGPLADRRVRQLTYGRLELVDPRDERTQLLQLTLVLRADDLGQKGIDHEDIGQPDARRTDRPCCPKRVLSIVEKRTGEVKYTLRAVPPMAAALTPGT